jgi:ribosomal protein S18 acetylase RimI-like enzyme
MKISIREYKESDLSILTKLLNENYMHYNDFYYSHEFIPYNEGMFDSKIVKNNLIFVAKTQEVLGFIALNKANWDNRIGIISVKPSIHQQEVENLLISHLESKVDTGRITITLTSKSPRIVSFKDNGYQTIGGLYHLTRTLTKIPSSPKLAKHVSLRSLEKEETLAQAFKIITYRNTNNLLKDWKETDPNFTLEWIHVAEIKGKIVSVVCTRTDHKYNKHFQARRGKIGPLATLPEYRERGIAKALMCKALNFFTSQKLDIASLKVIENNLSAQNLYRTLGFKTKQKWKFLRK